MRKPKNSGKSPLTWNDNDRIYELEKDLEHDAGTLATKRGWFHRKYQGVGRRSHPDRLFARNGRVFWVEFKRLGNHPTEQQWIEIGKMRDAGLDVVWLDSYEDFRAVLLQRE